MKKNLMAAILAVSMMCGTAVPAMAAEEFSATEIETAVEDGGAAEIEDTEETEAVKEDADAAEKDDKAETEGEEEKESVTERVFTEEELNADLVYIYIEEYDEDDEYYYVIHDVYVAPESIELMKAKLAHGIPVMIPAYYRERIKKQTNVEEAKTESNQSSGDSDVKLQENVVRDEPEYIQDVYSDFNDNYENIDEVCHMDREKEAVKEAGRAAVTKL